MSGTPTRNYTRLAIAIVIAALTISASVLAYSSVEATVTRTVTATGGAGSTPVSNTPDDAGGPGPLPGVPVTLNTVNYAINVVGAAVLIPNASAIGSGYRIVGVQISLRPVNDTTDNGTTWRHWTLIFVISNQPFANGSTQLDPLLRGYHCDRGLDPKPPQQLRCRHLLHGASDHLPHLPQRHQRHLCDRDPIEPVRARSGGADLHGGRPERTERLLSDRGRSERGPDLCWRNQLPADDEPREQHDPVRNQIRSDKTINQKRMENTFEVWPS
jgi:hypothetical protein